jgi:hypothetical protein
MKLYMVEVTTYAVVMARDEIHALNVADAYKRDIFGDDPSPNIDVDRAIEKLSDLKHGWDGECIPYGGDGNTRLADLVTPNV